MSKKSMDGNSAAAHIAYAFSEVSALYPITPSTTMGELMDTWSGEDRKNIFGEVVKVVEMQSEAGASGTVHGILSGGAFSSTFTASQGLLLMIPNMYKIAGELLPTVFHVSARAIAGHALSIFGDQQDVMATRATGFSFLCSSSVQECMDLALVAHLSSLKSSLPFLHFFDGFRTSHEIQKIDVIDYESIVPLVDMECVKKHRERALNPEHPYLKGSSQNPDIYFQGIESSNKLHLAVPEIVEEEMRKVSLLTKRNYSLFEYFGHPDAERVIVMMGSGCEAAEETARYLNNKGEKVGILKVRLYRPFSLKHFLQTLPKSVQKIAVLDRTKEVGSLGEPLYLDVVTALQGRSIKIVGGRYGLGSKDFTPTMAKAVFDNLKEENPKNQFTVGIEDDVTFTSLKLSAKIDTESPTTVRCKFWGIGGDGTIGANKDAIKIIGDNTSKEVQGYFVYDSKKSSGITISHLRFGDEKIKSTYLIEIADYIACHQPFYVQKYDLLDGLKKGGIFVLNCSWTLEQLEKELPASMKRYIAQNNIAFYTIDALSITKKVGLGGRINTVMQTVFFKLANVLPVDQAISLLKEAVAKTYQKKGEKVVKINQDAIDLSLNALVKVAYPESWKNCVDQTVKLDKPDFIKEVVDVMNAQKGDTLPVSVFPLGGIFPLGTTQYEKRGIASINPDWISENCIQCNLCSLVCPHAAIRPFLITEEEAKNAPKGYVGLKPIGKGLENLKFSVTVSPKDCVGCEQCAIACPAPKGKALVMKPSSELIDKEAPLWDYLSVLPSHSTPFSKFTVKGSQFNKPLLEFSGACAGCGETPYVKLLTQLFGDRMVIANATGCTSIWGGSAPSIPWTVNEKGYGPAWANSLFEDNAEFGYGIAMGLFHRREELAKYVQEALSKDTVAPDLKSLLEEWLQNRFIGEKTRELAEKIKTLLPPTFPELIARKDLFVKPSVWVIGGDGWAYDIGFGGLDHVLSQNVDINVLVLDTEVYSNTGGQASKATPLGAVAKFASFGKRTAKKDLGRMMMTYENVYIASVNFGYDKNQVIQALKDAESYQGPSLVIGYAACISHGIAEGLAKGLEEEKKAVESNYWLTYHYDPRLINENKNPLVLDSKAPIGDLETFLKGEIRYKVLEQLAPEVAKDLRQKLKDSLDRKYKEYQNLTKL